MNAKRKQRYLYIDGEAVPVTEKVYRAFWHYEDKEDYFMRQLKTPRVIRDKKLRMLLPCRPVRFHWIRFPCGAAAAQLL